MLIFTLHGDLDPIKKTGHRYQKVSRVPRSSCSDFYTNLKNGGKNGIR